MYLGPYTNPIDDKIETMIKYLANCSIHDSHDDLAIIIHRCRSDHAILSRIITKIDWNVRNLNTILECNLFNSYDSHVAMAMIMNNITMTDDMVKLLQDSDIILKCSMAIDVIINKNIWTAEFAYQLIYNKYIQETDDNESIKYNCSLYHLLSKYDINNPHVNVLLDLKCSKLLHKYNNHFCGSFSLKPHQGYFNFEGVRLLSILHDIGMEVDVYIITHVVVSVLNNVTAGTITGLIHLYNVKDNIRLAIDEYMISQPDIHDDLDHINLVRTVRSICIKIALESHPDIRIQTRQMFEEYVVMLDSNGHRCILNSFYTNEDINLLRQLSPHFVDLIDEAGHNLVMNEVIYSHGCCFAKYSNNINYTLNGRTAMHILYDKYIHNHEFSDIIFEDMLILHHFGLPLPDHLKPEDEKWCVDNYYKPSPDGRYKLHYYCYNGMINDIISMVKGHRKRQKV